MGALTDDVKAFVVQQLACFDTPTQVAEAVKQEFGLDVTRFQVAAYDPNKANGKRLSKKWCELFAATREKFLDDASSIPIANQTFRLRALNRMLTRAEHQGNAALAAQLLEQASKEIGGAYTNKHRLEHTGQNGGPIKTQNAPVDLSDLTDEELEVLERIAAKSGADPG